MFSRRPDGDVRNVVQLHDREVLEIDFGAIDLSYSHGVFESQSFAQRMVIHVGVVFGNALRVPISVRSYRQNAFVSEIRVTIIITIIIMVVVERPRPMTYDNTIRNEYR